jgi:LPXTG-motif cell wall-anchored protein
MNLTARFQENEKTENSEGENKKKGCGSTVGVFGVTGFAMLAGAMLTVKKRKED